MTFTRLLNGIWPGLARGTLTRIMHALHGDTAT